MARFCFQWLPRLLLLPALILASAGIAAADPATETERKSRFQTVQERLVSDGFNARKIATLYDHPEAAFEAEGVSLFFVHSEAKLNYDQFTSDWALERARAYMQSYRADLANTEKAYGVDATVITAILMVESGFGDYLGRHYSFNTLSTMAALADPEVRNAFWGEIPTERRLSREEYEQKAQRKSDWAYGELKALIKYAVREALDPVTIPGSYAGAVGLPQFMPSNIIAYARDGDGDGRIDLVNHADAIASIANYLKRHGWQPGMKPPKAEKVIYRYNHSSYYVNTILKISKRLKG
jgi:membrane-bound lytic murein transglycosylase B